MKYVEVKEFCQSLLKYLPYNTEIVQVHLKEVF